MSLLCTVDKDTSAATLPTDAEVLSRRLVNLRAGLEYLRDAIGEMVVELDAIAAAVPPVPVDD